MIILRYQTLSVLDVPEKLWQVLNVAQNFRNIFGPFRLPWARISRSEVKQWRQSENKWNNDQANLKRD